MVEVNTNKEVFWSRFAKDFEKRNNYVLGEKEIEFVKGQLLKYERLGKVLELGCGDGVYSKTILKNSTALIATDWSDEMVEAAKVSLKSFKSVIVQKENCFELSFGDESFDTVFMANLLHIIPEPEKALEESKRVLKPNGQIIILSFTLQEMKIAAKIGMLYRYFKTYGKPPKQSRKLTLENVIQMLEVGHFSILDAKLIGQKMKSILVVAEKPGSNLV